MRRLRSATHRRQLAAPALDVVGAIDLRRAGCQSGPVRLHRVLQESSWFLAAGARRQGLPQYPMNGQAYRARSVECEWEIHRIHRSKVGPIVDPSRILMKTHGFAIVPTGEPSWTHRGSKQDPCENIWFRPNPSVETILEPSRVQAGSLCKNMVSLTEQGGIHGGSKQDPCENIWFREI